MMDLSDIETALADQNETMVTLIAGLQELAGGLKNQTTLQVHHTALLNEILDLLTTQPEGESSLVTTLKELVAAIGHQSVILERIETAVRMGTK